MAAYRDKGLAGGMAELLVIVEAKAKEGTVGGDCQCVGTATACVGNVLVVQGSYDVWDELWLVAGAHSHVCEAQWMVRTRRVQVRSPRRP